MAKRGRPPDKIACVNGLAGKTVVVTGGSSGIGAAAVARFHEEGCTVVDLSRHPSPGGIACDVGELGRASCRERV